MALFLIEGFDQYSDETQCISGDKWASIDSTTYSSINASGRNGKCLLLNATFSGYITTTTGINQDSIYVGYARKGSAFGYDAYNYCFLQLYSSDHTIQCRIQHNAAGYLELRRGTSTILATSSDRLLQDIWQYIEIYIKVGNSDGACIIKIDGKEVLNVSSQDTQAHASTDLIDYLRIYEKGGYIDDVYIDTTQFHGDCHVETVYPNADGATTDFSLSGGSTHWELLDETTPDDATSYTYTSTATDQDLVEFTDFSADGGDFVGVSLDARMRKLIAGTRAIKLRVNSGTISDSGEKFLTTDWVSYNHVWETDPNTAAAWTRTNLGTADFGVLVTT